MSSDPPPAPESSPEDVLNGADEEPVLPQMDSDAPVPSSSTNPATSSDSTLSAAQPIPTRSIVSIDAPNDTSSAAVELGIDGWPKDPRVLAIHVKEAEDRVRANPL
jgi:hypothetical protein